MTINNINIFNKKKKLLLSKYLNNNYIYNQSYNLSENKKLLIVNNNYYKDSAVLCLLEPNLKNKRYDIVLTKRSQDLKSHPGQISFPGGKLEKNDNSNHIRCAYREAKEEINFNSECCSYLGKLNKYITGTGYLIQPVLAINEKKQVFAMNKDEVSRIIYFPIDLILNKKNIKKIFYNKSQFYYSLKWQGLNIWGATAKILIDLVSILKKI